MQGVSEPSQEKEVLFGQSNQSQEASNWRCTTRYIISLDDSLALPSHGDLTFVHGRVGRV